MATAPELFVVEGKAAANAVRNVRDRDTQFVHAVQGKPMNAAKASAAQLKANSRVDQLVRAITRNRADEYDPLHVPYERVILLTDGDVDGVHAKALLLVMIRAMLPDLIAKGRLFTVRAPQFSITCNERPEPVFAYSAEGRESVEDQLHQQGATKVRARHYKGLASMDADVLWNACLNPETRKLSALTAEHGEAAHAALSMQVQPASVETPG